MLGLITAKIINRTMIDIKTGILFGLLLIGLLPTYGQRIEIDRLDREFEGSYNSRKGYELSQKCIQLDSNYYVGHFYEAKYHFFRASDKRGYEMAITSLEKTIDLLEKNYPRQIKRSTDIRVYINRYEMQRRYTYLIDHLQQSYQYVDRPGDAIKVLRRLQKRDFVCNFGVNVYSSLCWIHYRNRAYGPEKYDFLKPNIEDNLRIASLYADSIKDSQKHNQQYLDQWWPGYAKSALSSYYHFQNIIYGYELKVDSAEYCSAQLEKMGRLSYNNHGNLQFIQAKYIDAEESYEIARDNDNYSWKSTKEFDYMQSTIKLFQNDIDGAKSIVSESIDYLGTAPGFGWNSIAMSRIHYYAGDLNMSKVHRDKADKFKEVHINSTWGEIDYNRNTLLFEYLYHKKSINEIMFRDKYFWYKPDKLYEIAKHYFNQENTHLLLTSELSADPERFNMLYNIFATDNTIFFDEMWELIKYFNPEYFIKIFEEKLSVDERENVHKYFEFLIGQFHLENEEYDKAITQYNKVLESESLDPSYEKLLLARTHEGLSKAYLAKDDELAADENLKLFYKNFPQLLPYTDVEMKFNLTVNKIGLSIDEQTIIDDLKNCDIEWVSSDPTWPTLTIDFTESEAGKSIDYNVTLDGNTLFTNNLTLDENQSMGQLLAFGAFGVTFDTTSE